jgi:microcystin-dependent protein
MAYADAANYNTLKSMKGFPIGSIIPWSGSLDSIPFGWILCNGVSPPVSRYPLLYEVIGNSYGGTEGTTFKLPTLTDGASAVMDIYQGHFNYLQNAGDAHRPENTVRSADSFWGLIGSADNGNRPGNTQTNWLSTIDVIGEQISRPDVVAKHEAFGLSEGDVSVTYSTNERKLSDRHVPNHNHDYETSGSVSYTRKGNRATKNSDRFRVGYACYKDGNATEVARSTNDPPINGTQMASVGASNTVGTTYRQGGGNIVNDQPTWDGQNRATGFDNGDGVSGGDMWAHRSGTRYFWSSLSHSETTFAQIAGHSHGSLEYNWVSKIKIINPGIVTNVKMNSVTIDNTSGRNFGSINMNSATPTLTMLFIIKAF